MTRVTGIARSTIGRGLAELRTGETPDAARIRRPGGGRKPVSETDASLLDDLGLLVEPQTRGDPQSPVLWTKLRKLGQSLRAGHMIGRTLVGELLHKLDYRLQANRKTREGSHNPDRDTQFHYINDRRSKSWPMSSAFPSPCVICRPAAASGTRSSTACSRSSPATGAANRSSAIRSSSC